MIRLNLLPPERKVLILGRARNRKITTVGAVVLILFLLIAVALFGATLYVGAVVAGQKRAIEQTEQDLKRYAALEQVVLAIRDRVSTLEQQEKGRILWSKIGEALAGATPEGTQLLQVSLSTITTPHVQFSGQADTKEKVASLRERVEDSDRFENVSIRQVGQTQDLEGKILTTFSLEANLTGVAPPPKDAKPKGVGE